MRQVRRDTRRAWEARFEVLLGGCWEGEMKVWWTWWVRQPAKQTVTIPADVLLSTARRIKPPYLPMPRSMKLAGPLLDMNGGNPWGGSLEDVVMDSIRCVNCDMNRVIGKIGRERS